ncbi:MAG: hypothetical protein HYV35_02695, partial [Lentisphaerae bacterium]|nr:hypothetical protein [Lentisphaerota bacterium]
AAPYRDVEDLLMSCTGRIHLFIGVPEMSAARFERFLAVGGFEVSAEKKGGAVVWLQVKSLVGAICRIRNPWYPGPLRAIDLASGAEAPVESAGDTVSFSTVAGHAYELRR